MREELLEAWRTNNRINLFLIDQISDAGMKDTLSKRGGREVARQFAHLHDVMRARTRPGRSLRDLGALGSDLSAGVAAA